MTLCLKGALLLGVLPFGATGAFAGNLATLAVGLAALGTLALDTGRNRTRGLERLAWLTAGGLAVYVCLQITGAFGLMPAHPIWAEASAALGETMSGSPSVSPATAAAALPSILAPFLMFIAGLRLMRTDEDALGMISTLAVLGGLVALFGLLQFTLAPDFVLFSEKPAYQDSLTAVFVNRNSAAAYFGCAIVLLLGLARWQIGGSSLRRSLSDLVSEDDGTQRNWRLALYAFLLAASTLALLLTKSRAGIACSAAAVMVYVALTAMKKGRRLASIAFLLGGALLIALVFFVFGGQTLYRAEVRGLDDARFCVLPGILAAARDNWPFGTGPGTFSLVFPAYRDPACGLYGVWNRAHNFFLEGTITLGVGFWVAAAMVLAGLSVTLVRGLRRRRSKRFGPAMGVSLVALLVLHDLIDFSLQIPGIALNTALALAACSTIALGRHRPAGGRARRPTAVEPSGVAQMQIKGDPNPS